MRYALPLLAALAAAGCSKKALPTPLPESVSWAKLPGLAGTVDVRYDTDDTPHVSCGRAVDCYEVQGYLHARDRLFQMDLARHLARGRMSQLLGRIQLDSDLFYRTVFTTPEGRRVETVLAEGLDADTRAIFEAYARGVTAYLHDLKLAKDGTQLPGEYLQLPVKVHAEDIQDWSVEDSLAVGRLEQWALSESLDNELKLGQAIAALPADQLTAFVRSAPASRNYTIAGFPYAAPHKRAAERPELAAQKALLARYAAPLARALEQAGRAREASAFARVSGSNNWVVDAAHSATGAAMVCNDTHLPLSYPAIFHVSHLTSTDGLNVAGTSFPGIPGALVGRGAHVGWGVTVAFYDVTDVYLEAMPDADHVTFNGQSVPVLKVDETFLVRDASGLTPEVHTIRVVPHHGPILPGTTVNGQAVSVKWTGQGLTFDSRAFLKLSRAADVASAFEAVKDMGTGAQNFVFADDSGHIGYYPHALVPVRRWDLKAHPPWAPLPGDGSCEWDGFIPDAELPQLRDPPEGFITTANNDMVGVTDDNDPTNDKYYLMFTADLGLRRERIASLLSAKPKLSLADLQAIQGDDYSLLGERLVPLLKRATDANPAWVAQHAMQPALDLWSGWSFHCPTGLTGLSPQSAPDPDPAVAKDSAACLLLHATWRRLIANTFGDDFDAAGIERRGGINTQLATKSLLFMLDPATDPRYRTLCDDQTTASVTESCDDMVLGALLAARDSLKGLQGDDPAAWRWGRLHALELDNLAAPLAGAPFEAGPFARHGGAFAVDVAEPEGVGVKNGTENVYTYASGAAVRWAATLDGSQTTIQIPGSEADRGEPTDGGISPTLEKYLNNRYWNVPYSAVEVSSAAVQSERFGP